MKMENDSRQRRLQRRRRARRRRMIMTALEIFAVACFVFLLVFLFRISSEAHGASYGAEDDDGVDEEGLLQNVFGSLSDRRDYSGEWIQGLPEEVFEKHPEWTVDYLTPNEYSRPGEALTEVKNIFVHYTANPGTSAEQNRSYFEQQKDMHQASVSSHFIIGYDGEILQILPLNEIGYAVKTRNYDSISIECCYKAENGQFTQETYDSLIALLAWLTEAYDLEGEDILRHYDCGGKKCPLYYVDHEDAWEKLKRDVEAYGAKG